MLPLLPQDKANHAIYGACIALGTLLAARYFGVSFHGLSPRHLAGAAALLAGAAEEAADYIANRRLLAAGLPPAHGVEFNDFLATASGGVLVWAAA